MNRAFKARQYVGHISSATRKQDKINNLALSAKMYKDVINGIFKALAIN